MFRIQKVENINHCHTVFDIFKLYDSKHVLSRVSTYITVINDANGAVF